MSIISNAGPDELYSSFYKKNQELCLKWEQYILERDGIVKGNYNAWSLSILSKVKGKKEWLINIKKATFSGGNLLFSSKEQNLQEILIFKTIFKNTGCKNFCISRSIFKRRERSHPFFEQIKLLVKDGINDLSLYEVRFKNTELIIVFHHKNDWFEMADKVLGFEYME